MWTILTGIKNFVVRSTTIGLSVVAFQQYVGGIIICTGPSMRPCVETNDILLTENITPRFGTIRRGDIVIARDPVKYSLICKRVVAISGDMVNFNGRLVTIPDAHVWLEGDNKENSTDSRDYGSIPIGNVHRRCFCKIWPRVDPDFGNGIPFYAEAAKDSKSKD